MQTVEITTSSPNSTNAVLPAGWMPIDTAPKDGTQILVYSKDEGIMWVSWDTEEVYYPGCKPRKCWCVPGSHQDEQGGAYTADNPTHWMPMPIPPACE